MRIAKNKLGEPDYEYTSVLKGKLIIVRIYHEPQYCVQIDTANDCHCYPLTYEQYSNYCDHAEMVLHPNKAVLEELSKKAHDNLMKFDSDQNLKRFWSNVLNHYERRLNAF